VGVGSKDVSKERWKRRKFRGFSIDYVLENYQNLKFFFWDLISYLRLTDVSMLFQNKKKLGSFRCFLLRHQILWREKHPANFSLFSICTLCLKWRTPIISDNIYKLQHIQAQVLYECVCLCVCVSIILMTTEGRFKWSITQVPPPKPIINSIVIQPVTCFTQNFLFYLITLKILWEVLIMKFLTLETAPSAVTSSFISEIQKI
jgi:hypothetical protein